MHFSTAGTTQTVTKVDCKVIRLSYQPSCRHLCNQTLMYKPEETGPEVHTLCILKTISLCDSWSMYQINVILQRLMSGRPLLCATYRGYLAHSTTAIAQLLLYFTYMMCKTIRMCIYVISCGATITVNKSFNIHLRTWSCLHCCRTAVRAEHPSCRMPLLSRLWKGT